jgi:broad specificity phosphatase PhoE
MTAPISIHFVRHGLVHNPKDIYYGRLPRMQLSAEGRRQAQAVAVALPSESFAAIYTSPLIRARQTAQLIAAQHEQLRPRISHLLNEVYSPFDGCPRSKMIARNWDVYTGVKPPYEQQSDVLARGQTFIMQLRRRYPKQHLIVVTHGDVIAFLILWSKGISITNDKKQALEELGVADGYPTPASLSTFIYHTSRYDELPDFEYTIPNAY